MSSNNGYPCVTKRWVAERIDSDDEFVVKAAVIITARTFQRDAATKAGKTLQGAHGWMSSHRVHGLRLGEVALLNQLRGKDLQAVRPMIRLYAKQLAAHLRSAQIRKDRSLATKAREYGIEVTK